MFWGSTLLEVIKEVESTVAAQGSCLNLGNAFTYTFEVGGEPLRQATMTAANPSTIHCGYRDAQDAEDTA